MVELSPGPLPASGSTCGTKSGAAPVLVWGQRTGDAFTVSAAGGESQTLTVPDKYATGIRFHTPMVATDSPETLRVCVGLAPGGPRRQCYPAAPPSP